jgi:hypothetical protein
MIEMLSMDCNTIAKKRLARQSKGGFGCRIAAKSQESSEGLIS